MVKIGLIGAGAIARHSYLPVLRQNRIMDLKAVVETNDRAAAALGQEFSLAYAGGDLDEALRHVDAVMVCLPNHLHYPFAKRCLEEGKHVLCEKPLCTSSADAEDLLRTAKKNSLVFTVAHVRRFLPAVREIKDIITRREFGSLKGFDFREGTVFSWPSVTGFAFDREKAGGGVLMDIGVHLLDILFQWAGDEVSSFQYADDCLGGLEATVDIRMAFRDGATGQVKLTRLSVLNNFYTLFFERAALSWNPFTPQRIYIRKANKKINIRKMTKENPIRSMLVHFSESVSKGKPPMVKGEEALTSLRFIESCYARRQAIPMPWFEAKGSARR